MELGPKAQFLLRYPTFHANPSKLATESAFGCKGGHAPRWPVEDFRATDYRLHMDTPSSVIGWFFPSTQTAEGRRLARLMGTCAAASMVTITAAKAGMHGAPTLASGASGAGYVLGQITVWLLITWRIWMAGRLAPAIGLVISALGLLGARGLNRVLLCLFLVVCFFNATRAAWARGD